MKHPLQRFCAVTVSPGSVLVFEVTVLNQEGKITRIGSRSTQRNNLYQLRGGPFVGITESICCFFAPSGELPSPEGNFQSWGDKTPPIAALFLGEYEAVRCLDIRDLQPLDPRFHAETRRVLEAIGLDHPLFRIGKVPLPPEPQIALPLEVEGAECGGILER